MEPWQFLKPAVPGFQTFDNYFSAQEEILQLKTELSMLLRRHRPLLISGSKGSGVTHLLNAICAQWIKDRKKVLYITGQSLVYVLKRIKAEGERARFKKFLLSFDLIAIDNLQFLYKKSAAFCSFIAELVQEGRQNQKQLIFGCSDPRKGLTRTKKYSMLFSLKRINLRTAASQYVFKILRDLCRYEVHIPDQLLYLISGYNGSMQQYVNCLISIRFKSKAEGIDLKALSSDQMEATFNIKNYFPRQQFRKGFINELPFTYGKVKVAQPWLSS
jgi:chromosomal replication initiation ATPase DnaA